MRLRFIADKERIPGIGIGRAIQCCIEYRTKQMFTILSNVVLVAMHLVECWALLAECTTHDKSRSGSQRLATEQTPSRDHSHTAPQYWNQY